MPPVLCLAPLKIFRNNFWDHFGFNFALTLTEKGSFLDDINDPCVRNEGKNYFKK